MDPKADGSPPSAAKGGAGTPSAAKGSRQILHWIPRYDALRATYQRPGDGFDLPLFTSIANNFRRLREGRTMQCFNVLQEMGLALMLSDPGLLAAMNETKARSSQGIYVDTLVGTVMNYLTPAPATKKYLTAKDSQPRGDATAADSQPRGDDDYNFVGSQLRCPPFPFTRVSILGARLGRLVAEPAFLGAIAACRDWATEVALEDFTFTDGAALQLAVSFVRDNYVVQSFGVERSVMPNFRLLVSEANRNNARRGLRRRDRAAYLQAVEEWRKLEILEGIPRNVLRTIGDLVGRGQRDAIFSFDSVSEPM